MTYSSAPLGRQQTKCNKLYSSSQTVFAWTYQAIASRKPDAMS